MSEENPENGTPNAEGEGVTPEETPAETQEVKDDALLKAEQKIVELKKENKALKGTKEPESTVETKPETSDKSDEPDYAKIAFLNQKGVEHLDDVKIVQDEADRLKLPLTDVLEMEHIKAKLQVNKDQRNAQAGMPSGKGTTGATGQRDVDYWLQKGGLPEDQELASKVVEARMKKDDSQKMFSDELFSKEVG